MGRQRRGSLSGRFSGFDLSGWREDDPIKRRAVLEFGYDNISSAHGISGRTYYLGGWVGCSGQSPAVCLGAGGGDEAPQQNYWGFRVGNWEHLLRPGRAGFFCPCYRAALFYSQRWQPECFWDISEGLQVARLPAEVLINIILVSRLGWK